MSISSIQSNSEEIEVIGEVAGKRFWTNKCLTFIPTHQQLYGMDDQTLKNAAYTDPIHQTGMRQERYTAPHDRKTAESQGFRPGEEYWGICRAMIHLLFREESRREKARLLFEQEMDEWQNRLMNNLPERHCVGGVINL
jgi:hypothetical protein